VSALTSTFISLPLQVTACTVPADDVSPVALCCQQSVPAATAVGKFLECDESGSLEDVPTSILTFSASSKQHGFVYRWTALLVDRKQQFLAHISKQNINVSKGYYLTCCTQITQTVVMSNELCCISLAEISTVQCIL